MAKKSELNESKSAVGRFIAVFSLVMGIGLLIYFFRVPLRYESARIEKRAFGNGHNDWMQGRTIVSKNSNCASCHSKSLPFTRSPGFGK